MNRRRSLASEGAAGGKGSVEPLPSLESRLDELQLQLDTLTRVARELRRQIDARKRTTLGATHTPADPDRES